MSCCQLKDAKMLSAIKYHMYSVSNLKDLWKLSASLSNSDPSWMTVGQISEAGVLDVPEEHPKENMLDTPNWVKRLSDEEEILIRMNLAGFNVSSDNAHEMRKYC